MGNLNAKLMGGGDCLKQYKYSNNIRLLTLF